MKQIKIRTVLFVAIIVVAFSFYAVHSAQKIAGSGGKSGSSAGSKTVAQASASFPVKTSLAAVKTLRPYIDESGNVEANVNVDVYPDIGGRLVNFTVAIGDSVTKGQTIARVDPSKPGSNYSISPIVAPITGTVTGIPIDRGATVTTSTAVATVGIIDDLKISVALSERDSAKAAKGMTAQVSFEALPDETFSAVVNRVSPVLDATSRTREITLGFTKQDRRISAGMYAKVRLFISPVAGKVTVPASAIVSRNNENFVFVVSDKSGSTAAEKRVVKTGTTVDSDIAILDGISAGEQIVSEGQDNLTEGVAISIVKEGTK